MPEPNILFLFTDQHRWDALGCAGHHRVRTPHLDRLAASGVRFRHACTPTPVCVPARMSLITGQRASRTRWPTNRPLPGPLPELPTLMSLLLRAGYWTQGIGKMHFSGRHYGLRRLLTQEECVEHRPDDDYLLYLRERGVRTRFPLGVRDLLQYQPQTCGIPAEHSPINWVADRSVQFLREHARYRKGRPFFLWASWIAPHPPFAPCEPYDGLYEPAETELPFFTERPLATLPSCLWNRRARLDGAHRDPPRMRRIRSLYYGQVTHVDDAVGRVLAELEALGFGDSTAVFFMSDHGDMLGDHGLSRKGSPYESSVRVPLILRWPGKTDAGTVCGDPVGLTDVLPTIFGELGLEYPADACGVLAGESLLGRRGGGLAGGRELYAIDYGVDRSRWICLRSAGRKYILFAEEGREELYDLESDPQERRNLAPDRRSAAAELRERAVDWERRCGLSSSFEGGRFRVWPGPRRVPREEDLQSVVLNQGAWPRNLPEEEKGSVESFAEAFSRAISKETTLSPDRLPIGLYKRMGGESLEGTPWEAAWRKA